MSAIWNVEYIACKFDYSDGECNKTKEMIRKNKQKQWLKNKNNIFYFLNKHTFPSLYHMIKGNYLENIKKKQVVIYITMITNVRL